MDDNKPAWTPTAEIIQSANITEWMKKSGFSSVPAFHRWTVTEPLEFWQAIIAKLGIVFHKPPVSICDLSEGVEKPNWLLGAKMNITESCLAADPTKIAIISQRKGEALIKFTYAELNQLSNQIANGLKNKNYQPGDAIAIAMPMTIQAVAIYLGIIKMGGVVVSIADSFSAEEMATRLRISNAKVIFTQDFILREQKKLPLYAKSVAANAPPAIVLENESKLRDQDCSWEDFLSPNTVFKIHSCDPMTHCNILFSSGTTGDPKAIPWNHTTGIKAASDAYFHHNIKADDILAWPTNLGWMMGPWLIYAGLMNKATIALYDGVPREREFGEFVQDAKVTILGVVPTLVAAWRQSKCMENLNWQAIKLFTSTGECSNANDMLYLMSLAGNKPVIEYCGGTEIGGAYLTSTVVENNYPAEFSTPAMGIDFVLLDGEVALVGPSIGLSTELLNADHHATYYASMPEGLRRHGDHVERLPNHYYSVQGRVDDTMNLGGIKISSAEIERVLIGIDDILETAAVAPLIQGPSQLIIYAATQKELNKELVKKLMQTRINQFLNPLFKIHDVIFVRELPKTASSKIMRRLLRNK